MHITDKSIQAYIRKAQKDISKKYLYYSIGTNLWLEHSALKPAYVKRLT